MRADEALAIGLVDRVVPKGRRGTSGAALGGRARQGRRRRHGAREAGRSTRARPCSRRRARSRAAKRSSRCSAPTTPSPACSRSSPTVPGKAKFSGPAEARTRPRNSAAQAQRCQANARVRLTVARRSSPHGSANTIGTSTPLSAYACTASRTCCLVAHDLDRVDPGVADRRERALAVTCSPSGSGSAVTSSTKPARCELRRVRGHDRVVEEVLAGEVGIPVAVGDRAVHVRVDLRVAARADVLDAPRDERGREVVQQHDVGELAAEAQHLLVQRRQRDLRAAVAELQAEPEALDVVEVALERRRSRRSDTPASSVRNSRTCAIGRSV